MGRSLTTQDFLSLTKSSNFRTEQELQNHLISQLPTLLGVNPNQIQQEVITTVQHGEESNRADIVVYSKVNEKYKKALIVFEVELHSSVANFHNNDYEYSFKQLSKYAQVLQAPYGIIISDQKCKIYKFDLKGKEKPISSLPPVSQIERELTRRLFLQFLSRPGSENYFTGFVLSAIVIGGICYYLFLFYSTIYE